MKAISTIFAIFCVITFSVAAQLPVLESSYGNLIDQFEYRMAQFDGSNISNSITDLRLNLINGNNEELLLWEESVSQMVEEEEMRWLQHAEQVMGDALKLVDDDDRPVVSVWLNEIVDLYKRQIATELKRIVILQENRWRDEEKKREIERTMVTIASNSGARFRYP